MSIYARRFGLESIINASGTMTVLGGSLMPPEVIAAMNEAAKDWVRLPDLLDVVGARIAEIADVEACLISSGCAACITLSTAACITGMDATKMAKLPDTTGMKNELIWQRGHYPAYEAQFAAAGAKCVVVGGEPVELDLLTWVGENAIPVRRTVGVSKDDVVQAITEHTCAFAYTVGWFLPQEGVLPLTDFCDLAHEHDLPVIVDAASELPYLTNGRFDLGRFNRMGADIVCISGGKAMRGPNDTGIALGRKELVEAAKMQSNPSRGIGRGFKVSKEQVMGLLVAIERCATLDWNHVLQEEKARVAYLLEELAPIPHIEVFEVFPDETGLPVPRVWIRLDEAALGTSAAKVMEKMRRGTPSIYLRHGYTDLGIIIVDVQVLRDGEERVVAQRLKDILVMNK